MMQRENSKQDKYSTADGIGNDSRIGGGGGGEEEERRGGGEEGELGGRGVTEVCTPTGQEMEQWMERGHDR